MTRLGRHVGPVRVLAVQLRRLRRFQGLSFSMPSVSRRSSVRQVANRRLEFPRIRPQNMHRLPSRLTIGIRATQPPARAQPHRAFSIAPNPVSSATDFGVESMDGVGVADNVGAVVDEISVMLAAGILLDLCHPESPMSGTATGRRHSWEAVGDRPSSGFGVSPTTSRDRRPQACASPAQTRRTCFYGRVEVPLSDHPIPGPDRQGQDTMGDKVVESAWGAVPALLPVCFPRPLAEPGVRLSTHPALHGQLFGSVLCR
jgi:hypothetical protein